MEMRESVPAMKIEVYYMEMGSFCATEFRFRDACPSQMLSNSMAFPTRNVILSFVPSLQHLHKGSTISRVRPLYLYVYK